MFGEPGHGSRHRRANSAHGRRWPKRILFGFASLVIVVLVVAVGGYLYLDHELGAIPRLQVVGLRAVRAGEPTDVLLVGTDARPCAASAGASQTGGRKAVAPRSRQRIDSVSVARLFPDGSIEILSIPRDTLFETVGKKATVALIAADGRGTAGLVRGIEERLRVPINHVAEVNFCGLPAMVDALGGLYMDFPDPVRDAYSGLDVTRSGCQLVGGSEALAFVRSRHLYYFSKGSWHYDGLGELSRIDRRQALFRAVVDRLRTTEPNVLRLNAFVNAAAHGLAVDGGMSSSDLLSLGWRYHGLAQSGLATSVLPTTRAVRSGQDVLVAVSRADRQMVEAFLSGDTKAFEGAGGAPRHTAAAIMTSRVPSRNLAEPWNPVAC